MNQIACLTVALCFLAGTADAEIYRHTDSNGNVVFTDQPPEDSNAERIDLPPVNTIRPTPRPATAAPAAQAPQAARNYTSLVLASSLGNVASNPSTPLVISAAPDIPLQPRHRLVFFMNGKEMAVPEGNLSIGIPDPARGEQSFVAEIRDESGKPLIRSSPLTVQIHRSGIPPARVTPR